jgi:RNA polymerase sigma factor (sigma-70 family)
MNDLEFVQKCVRADKHAWNEFLSKYSRLIYNYIYSTSRAKGHNLSLDNVNDIFQEIFVLLSKEDYQKLRTFKAKNGCSLASWLRQVVIHFTIDYLRKFRPLVSLDEEREEGLGLKDALADDALSVPELITGEEKLLSLKDCIDKLDLDDKYFLELHLNQGLTADELKDIFNLSRPAVDMRKFRIINDLRDCFKAKGFLLDF